MKNALLEGALFLLAVLFHELGHVLAVFCSGYGIRCLGVDRKGLFLGTDSPLIPYRKEIRIYLSGPLAGLFTALITFFFIRRHLSYPLLYFFFCNVFFSLLNLLPIRALDGYGALRAFLFLKIGPDKSERILLFWHRVFLFLLLFFGAFLCCSWKNPSLIWLSCFLLLDGKRKKVTMNS